MKIAFHMFQVPIQNRDTTRHTPPGVIVLLCICDILARVEMVPFLAILDQLSTTATVA